MAHSYFGLMEVDQISHAVQFARNHGVFDALAEAPANAAQLAQRLGGAERAYTPLLQALTALGYLNVVKGRYCCSKELLELLSDSSLRWKHLPKFMQTGMPWIESDRSLHDVEKFYSSFFSDIPYLEQMTPAAEGVAEKLGGTPEEILDIGTGAGTWSFAMARISTARVTGVDLPEVLQHHFLPSANKVGLADRVQIIAGDFHEISLPLEHYDRIVMGSSFHFLHEEKANPFLRRVAAALKENGEFVVIDHFADTTAEQRLSRTLYEMRLAMRTLYAKNYSKDEIGVLCTENGFITERAFDAEGPGFLSVLVFRKA